MSAAKLAASRRRGRFERIIELPIGTAVAGLRWAANCGPTVEQTTRHTVFEGLEKDVRTLIDKAYFIRRGAMTH
jgi:hypothetical protein